MATKKKATTRRKKPARATTRKTSARTTNKKTSSAKKLSALDATAKVLGESRKAMSCRELVDAMAAKRYWKSPGGKTPDRTLCSAILREIKTKGKGARFKKVERGKFGLAGKR